MFEQMRYLLVFCQEPLVLNVQVMGKALDSCLMFEELESIICNGFHSFHIISLEKDNFQNLLFSKENNLLNIISKYSPQSMIFIFVAQSIIDLSKESNQGNQGTE